jgi:hypothetical protein
MLTVYWSCYLGLAVNGKNGQYNCEDSQNSAHFSGLQLSNSQAYRNLAPPQEHLSGLSPSAAGVLSSSTSFSSSMRLI